MGDRGAEVEVVRDAALRRVRGGFRDQRILDEAEDIAQETVTRYLEVTDEETIANPAGWANRVAGNLAFSQLRDRKRDGLLPEDIDQTTEAVEMFVCHGLMTSAQGIAREQASRLIMQLNDREAELVARTVEGQSQQEIAEGMGYASAESVRVVLHRIRARMKTGAEEAGLAPDWGDHPRPY